MSEPAPERTGETAPIAGVPARLEAAPKLISRSEVIALALSAGAYRVLAWVVSVMLPPMAIFFPMFTFLEELGYLPRAAFNMDHYFSRSGSCGKQALTMCMG